MTESLHFVDLDGKRKDYGSCRDVRTLGLHTLAMAKDRPKNHLRAWRKFRRMTQEQLAEAIGTSKAVIGHLETGRSGLSDKWLSKLAPALNTSPGHLLEHDPEALPTDVLDVWRDVPEDRRQEGLDMLRILARKRA